SLTQSGTFNISTPDGLDDLTIGGTTVIENGVFTATTIAAPDGLGSLRITAFNAATGEVSYSFTLADNADHASGNGENDAFASFAVVVTDTDGDSASNSLVVRIVDDVPTITATGAADALTVDESDLTTDASANFADNFTIVAGADGQASVTYALSATDETDSGLVDTATGYKVYLFEEGGEIVGRVGNSDDTANDAGAIVFMLSVNGSGTVELDQLRAVEHGDNTEANEAVSLAANVVTLTATVTDGDGDTASDSIQLGSTISFRDDGPTITVTGAADALTVDESDLTTDVTANFADNFTIVVGADGQSSVTYALSVTDETDSGLVDTATGYKVYLFEESGEIVGRVGNSDDTANDAGAIVFTLSVNSAGTVELDQLRAVEHGDNTEANEAVSLAANVVTLTATVTDGDGDTASDSIQLGSTISFRDDAPIANNDADSVTEDGATVATGNVITGTDVQSGDANSSDGVADDAGADGLASISWAGASSNNVAGTYGTLSVGGNGNYRYQLNNDAAAVQALDSGETLTETFTYTITDGDGDTDTATLTITINGADDLDVADVSVTVDEAALDTTEDSADLAASTVTGSDPSSGAETQSGSFTLNSGLTITQFSYTNDAGTGTATANAGQEVNTEFGSLIVNSDGTFTYTLTEAADHSGGAVAESVTVTLSNGETAELTVNIRDDAPVAANDRDTVNELSTTTITTPQNIGIVLDMSGSVERTGFRQQISSLREFGRDLFNAGDDVTISVVGFANDGGVLGVFRSFTALNNALNGIQIFADNDIRFTEPDGNLFRGGGATDYEAGLEELFRSTSASDDGAGYSYKAGANNQIFFISDGQRSEGGWSFSSVNTNGNSSRINSGQIKFTGVGVGDQLDEDDFEDFFGSNLIDADDVISINSFSNLGDSLITDVIIQNGENITTGNVLGNDDDGADGYHDPEIVGLAFNGVDASSSTSGGITTYTINTSDFKLTLDENGNYRFEFKKNIKDSRIVNFEYTTRDQDGTESTAALTIAVTAIDAGDNALPTVSVFTNLTGDVSFNSELLERMIGEPSDSSQRYDVEAETLRAGSGDTSIDYTVEVEDSSTGVVDRTLDLAATVNRETGTTFNGDNDANLIILGDGNDTVEARQGDDTVFGGAGEDTLIGNIGDDLLIGGADNDTLEGRLDDDIMIGGAGDDILRGGAGSDVFVGGAGDDTYDGAGQSGHTEGVDIFVLNAAGDGLDTINGFQSGDKLNLHDILDGLTGVDSGDIDLVDSNSAVQTEIDGNDTLIKVVDGGTETTVARITNYTNVTNNDLEFTDRVANVETDLM
ncbi:DUF5801 repeats-in-toxin domain-containing protein, partial [Kiloniella sp. b19]|uniref:DUF5801 repeats-in-toxin domain-containing protein n=1 Tax=Kiloniella sp. GXU_MW_B19 TaxID=3141326 RepID=UPI0031D50206